MEYNAVIRKNNGEIMGKLLLSDLRNLPPNWRVTFENKVLDRNTSLKNLPCNKVFPLSIYMNSVEENSFVVVVKTVSEKVIKLDVQSADKIEHLKEMIYKKEGISPDKQRFIFKGQELRNARTVADYKIAPDSTIYMQISLRGGVSIHEVVW